MKIATLKIENYEKNSHYSDIIVKFCSNYYSCIYPTFTLSHFKGKDFDSDSTSSEHSSPSKRQKIDKGRYCITLGSFEFVKSPFLS